MKPNFEPWGRTALYASKIGRLVSGGDLHSATPRYPVYRPPSGFDDTRGHLSPFHTIVHILGGSLENCEKVGFEPAVEMVIFRLFV